MCRESNHNMRRTARFARCRCSIFATGQSSLESGPKSGAYSEDVSLGREKKVKTRREKIKKATPRHRRKRNWGAHGHCR